MKSQPITNEIAVSSLESNPFTIKANGKAFRALIKTLYENKFQSIVRETWSNALDSHRSAGCEDKPFQVTLPSVYNPVLSVRDFGTSLEHGEIMFLYSTVFESTKEDNEEDTGKFGLGSKSPFAYSDTFSITAIKDGIKRHYTALIGKTGIPEIHFLGREDTDEPTGLEVSFPVNSRDISAFRAAARRVSHGFDVKPIVIPGDEQEEEFRGWPALDVVIEGDGWRVLNGNIEGYSSMAYAKMGPVLYPINVNAIEGLSIAGRNLMRAALIIDFKMGELEMTPSREALSYGSDEPTEASIIRKVEAIMAEMVGTYQARYDACKTYWEACAQFVADDNVNTPKAVRDILVKTANWKGQILQKAIKFLDQEFGADTYVDVLSGTSRYNKVLRFKHQSKIEIVPDKSTIMFIEDINADSRAQARISYYLSNNTTPRNIIWVKARSENLRQKKAPAIDLLEYFAGVETLLVSDLELPPRPARVPGQKGSRRHVSLRMFFGGDHRTNVDVTPEEFDAGGYYFKLFRNEPEHPSNMATPQKMVEALVEAGVISANTPVYGVPKTLWKRFSADQWVDIYDAGVKAYRASNPKASLQKEAMINSILGDRFLRFLKQNFSLKTVPEGPVKEALILYKRTSALTIPDVRGYRMLASVTGNGHEITGLTSFDSTELDECKKRVHESYPLIEMFERKCPYEDKLVDKLLHYVQVCSKAAEHDSHNKVAVAA